MRASAAAAVSSLVAATAAPGAPTKRTLSSASACSSWLTGRMPKGIGRSLPVSTAFTPGRPAAFAVSMRTMRACGCGLRSSFAYSIRGRKRSSANFVTPATLAVASTLRWAFPTTRRADGRTGGRADGGSVPFPSGGPPVRLSALFLPDAIQGLRDRLRVLASEAGRGQLYRLVDLDVAGAAAEVAGEGLLDLLPHRPRVPGEQRLGGEQKGRGAVAALRRAELGESLL